MGVVATEVETEREVVTVGTAAREAGVEADWVALVDYTVVEEAAARVEVVKAAAQAEDTAAAEKVAVQAGETAAAEKVAETEALAEQKVATAEADWQAASMAGNIQGRKRYSTNHIYSPGSIAFSSHHSLPDNTGHSCSK